MVTVSALAVAQGDLRLPELPLEVVPNADLRGLRVEIVDAVSGASVEGASFRWVEPVPRQSDAHLLPRGNHWFEASAPGHIRRRDVLRVVTPEPGGVLRIQVLPEFLLVRGQLRPKIACEVSAPDELAVSPLFAATTHAGMDGKVELALRHTDQPIVLTARIGSRNWTITTPTARRAESDLPPHMGIPTVTATLDLKLDERDVAAVAVIEKAMTARATVGRRDRAWVAATDAGTAWLVAHQDEDGRWDADGFGKHDRTEPKCDGTGAALIDVGITGLALLALLGDGHTPIHGEHAHATRRGVEWLLKQRINDDILLSIDQKQVPGEFFYQHCIGTLALCEAYASGGEEAWRPTIQRVVDYIEAHRNPYGAWSYFSRQGSNTLSMSLWATLALVSARRAGFTIAPPALEYVTSYTNEMTDANGRAGYSERGGWSARIDEAHAQRFPADRNEAMTGAGLLICAALGHDVRRKPLMAASVALLARRPPVWEERSLDFYGWSLSSQAMWLTGGKQWEPWAKALTAAVVKHQRIDGNFAGSWDPIDAWGHIGGRVYATAMLLLALESPWRLPRS